jgi:hypothetical protein
MPEYISLDPNVEVLGDVILSLKEAIISLSLDPQPFLEKYGLGAVRPGNWYSLQKSLDAMKDMHDNIGDMFALISVGSGISETAQWPPDIDTVESAFAAIDMAYHMNHRNGDIGHYQTELITPGHVRVTACNPYPSDFDYGLCYGLAKRFLPHNAHIKVERAASPCRLKGDDCCVYDVTWVL